MSIVISDPAACKGSGGPFTHVYVTIADVQASTNADAAPNDPSFVDLTPGLSAAPKQVDLMGQANSSCFLASLGVGQQVTAGNYEQVRIFLAPDSHASSISNNACGASYANCLVRTDNSLHDLVLPTAASQGIELMGNSIINGSIAFNAGDNPYIDLNIDVCSSILAAANGEYELNPIIHAGLIPSSGSTISGTVVSSKTGQPLSGGSVVVALEQKDPATGIDRILMRTSAGSDGTFILCPVPQGTYDLVAVGVDGASVSYSAGVEMGIQSGQLADKIPLVPGSQQGTLEGLITTQGTGTNPLGVSLAVQAGALQQIATDGATITVPLLPGQSPYDEAMLTTDGSSCAGGVDCAPFSMQLPTSTPNVVACSEQTAQFKQQQGSTPGYTAESVAAIPGTGTEAACTSGSLEAPNGPVSVRSGETTMASAIGFKQCQ
ncbi:MAG TPA: DUF4382 domain-containing protein [Acidobacteriaceae bacterium]|nr:DUF4382 domain-containing protein [Acidobacteriaceae bacterium]